MTDAKSLRDLFVENLRHAYDAEKRLVETLPDVRDAAHSPDLKHALQAHLEVTGVHVSRLEQIFDWFGEKPKSERCKSIDGILDDGKHVTELKGDPDVIDAALIAAAQEAEHFEIAMYGTLRAWAAQLGKNEAMETLQVTLEEEKAADGLLTNIAERLNLRAAHAH